MNFKFKSMLSTSVIFRTLVTLVLIIAFIGEAFGDVCVWRDPERTMTKLFPKAKDYLTIDKKISAEVRERIERRLGKPLDPGERENWIYYEIKGSNGEPLGYILTDAEKGEYGAIEIVMGVMPNGTIIGLYIQRARERDKTFRSKEFLEQFTGKTQGDPIQIGNDIKAESVLATEQVAFGVRKMVVMFDELH